jgi:cyclopropane-fatty-acyl-phospholipid synthase
VSGIGNDLFERMLDPTMMYSCALFEREGMTLEEASVAKLERVCERLEIGPEDHVLEIGTGWGGFAIHAAATRCCRVTTTTISREQHDFARQRVHAAGLSDRITVLLEDYRDLRGSYDKLVSIEMVEAVGWEYLDTYFARCAELLRPEGSMLLQAIVMPDRLHRLERATTGFINTFVFPGGSLPSLAAIERSIARTDLRTVHLEDITPHYARTLQCWRQRFLAAAGVLAKTGYDERFQRLWTLYLAYCEAGFAERRIHNVQIQFAKPAFRGEALYGLGNAESAASASGEPTLRLAARG